MTIYSIPTIGNKGIVSDVDAVVTSISAWSTAVNVRFEDFRMSRGPIFSKYWTMMTNPRQMTAYRDGNGVDHFVVVDNFLRVYEINAASQVEITPTASFTPSDTYSPVSYCYLSNVLFFNRADKSPIYRATGSTGTFANLSTYDSGWRDTTNTSELPNLPADIRFRVLRSYNNMLIGLGIQQGNIRAPKSLRWSDYAITDGQPPLDWEIDSTQSSAGQNTLAQMVGDIVDATPLNDMLIIHGSKETWSMQANGNTGTIFNFNRLFDAGVMSVNCAVEHEGLLYVFGDKDLYKTDGHTKQTIAYGRVQRFILENIVNTERDKSFVFHNPSLNEILFCFVSNDPWCAFLASTANPGCNRAVVYNYQADTFYYYDLPYVTSATLVNTYSGLTWDGANTAGMTWDAFTGSWAGLANGATDVVAIGSNASVAPFAASASIRTHAIFENTVAAGVLDNFANTPAVAIKQTMDCSALTEFPGLAAKLREYKLFSGLYAKGELYSGSGPVTVTIGTADSPSAAPSYGYPMQWGYVGGIEYNKLDYNQAGRFLTIKVQYNDHSSFRLDGFDVDVTVLGGYGR